jgi:hypothetical protein
MFVTEGYLHIHRQQNREGTSHAMQAAMNSGHGYLFDDDLVGFEIFWIRLVIYPLETF